MGYFNRVRVWRGGIRKSSGEWSGTAREFGWDGEWSGGVEGYVGEKCGGVFWKN